MQTHHYKKKKSLIGTFLEYGFHLWILLFVSNLLIFYSFSFFSFGAEDTTQPAPSISPAEVSPAVTKPPAPVKRVPTPRPNGPVISLSFSVSGIGSAGGTFTPTRLKRNLTVYLYATDVNSNDNKVKPLYTIHTTAEYDTNKFSSTYTSFVNPRIDLGDTVKNAKYQIAFTTDQALRKLVKDKDDSIGGKIVVLARSNSKTILPPQRVVMGDMSPTRGNNIMDINDYNVLVDCFGQTQTSCNYFKYADLNDDGEVDGIDYNIMARSFRTLVGEGLAPPQLPTPKPSHILKPSRPVISPKITTIVKVSPSPAPVKKTSSGNPLGAFFGFLIFLALLGGGGFFVATKTSFGINLLKTILTKISELRKKETTTPAATPNTEVAPTETTPEVIAESTEIPIAQAEAEKKAAPTADTNAIDKTYYVKNKSKDEKGTWVVLTDDVGPIDGLLVTGTIEDGFERIKGTLVTEKAKKYVLINEILPAE
jgi:hypothetical protein